MASTLNTASPSYRALALEDDLRLGETHHRCSNDLQLVVSLLAFQSRRAESTETRQALTDAMERVAVLACARVSLQHERQPTLEAALRHVCEALHSQAEPRSILVLLDVAPSTSGLSPVQITTLALIVNELATNAIKHAFACDRPGCISIRFGNMTVAILRSLSMTMGFPFPSLAFGAAAGSG
nr:MULTISPECIES: sensor histidine kinase [unclassified Sphingomonas]